MRKKLWLPFAFVILAMVVTVSMSAFKEKKSPEPDAPKAFSTWFKYIGPGDPLTDPSAYAPFPSGESEALCDDGDEICAINDVPNGDEPTLTNPALLQEIEKAVEGDPYNSNLVKKRD